MEHYPEYYVSQSAPLVVIQGLGKEAPQNTSSHRSTPMDSYKLKNRTESHPSLGESNSEKLERILPEVSTEFSSQLINLFRRHDISDDVWCSQFTKTSYNSNTLVYKFRFVDVKFRLPNIAQLPETPVVKQLPLVSAEKSILSPFNPNSAIYPQGILDDHWLIKYKELVPSVFISVHRIVAEKDQSNDDPDYFTKLDMGLSKEITTLKNQTQNRGIRFLEIIVSDQSNSTNPELSDRINNIRNITGLAPRTGLLFLPAGSGKEYNIFVEAVLHLIRPWCFDYYINLEKKFRRKRVNPPTTQLSKSITLSETHDNSGKITGYSLDQWDARYSSKLALTNLFHQNNEMSVKHLESAYESLTLLAGDIPLAACYNDESAVLLWHQTRQLLDILTINIVREYLYLELANKAYRRFDNHLSNVMSIIKKKSIDSKSYAAYNWLSIQFEWFGELCVMADEYIVPVDKPLLNDFNFGASAMPQPGYVFLQSVNFSRIAKGKTESMALANKIIDKPIKEKLILSEKDAKAFLETKDISKNVVLKYDDGAFEFFDCYLSLPVEKQVHFPFHQKLIVLLQKASVSFMKAKANDFERSISYINFQLGEENYCLGNSEKAIEYYEECVGYYKQDNWRTILVCILYKLVCSLAKVKKWNALIMYMLELAIVDEIFYTPEIKRLLNEMEIQDLLSFEEGKELPLINIYPLDETILPPHLFTGVFLFKDHILPLSKTCQMQLSLKNLMNSLVLVNLNLESIVIDFEGYLKPIVLRHDESKEDLKLNDLKEEDFANEFDENMDKDVLVGNTNLSFQSQEHKVFQFSQLASKIANNSVSSIVLNLAHQKFKLKYYLPTIPHLADDGFLDSKNNSAKVTPHSVDVNSNYYVNRLPKTNFFWIRGATMKKTIVSTPNPYEFITIPRRPETQISVENPTSAHSNEIYELKLVIDNNDKEDIGMIFRPLVKMYDTKSLARPSSRVSSTVTSPRNSLDLRDRSPGDLGDSILSQAAVATDKGVRIMKLQWDAFDKLVADDDVDDRKDLDFRLKNVKATSKEHHSLFIKVPNVIHKHFVIKIECSFFTGDNIVKQQESEEEMRTLGTRDTFSIRTPIAAPVTFSFGVLPEVRFEDIPNSFLFDSTNPYNSDSIVAHSRTWCGRPVIKYSSNIPIDIIDIYSEVVTPNHEEFICEKLDYNEKFAPVTLGTDHQQIVKSKQLFTTRKKNSKHHSNIPVHFKVIVKWKRHGNHEAGIINTTESQIWKLTLPLFEPRVLFNMTPVDHDEKSFNFHYIIENPTPRIFSFSTFIESNDNFEVSGYNRDLSQLPVLPFTRQPLEFKATAKKRGTKLKIPGLKVYDLVYKVTLPVLLATTDASADRSDIYISV
ncbi:hypothetical protein DASC09_049660 [Saccharomycopsis crataegensis]|uniref:Uncharacterized protein n=1 Tax=Saccharomycopsis crataegensis TaxID=43959 RepID=A0AAV5QSZ2_9ASCO|nr:hypothetical protein DASC09_049660 [Saccharomycopsis crataegensis]